MIFTKKRKGKISISSMLTISIIVTIFVASSLSVFISYINAKENASSELNKDIKRNINEITDIIEMPLWSYDIETIEDIGKLYSKDETIVNLRIIDSLGKMLFEMDRKSRGRIIKSKKKVIHEGQTAGVVELSISSDRYEKSIKQLVLSGSFTIILNLVLLLGLTGFFLKRFLNKPLLKLSEIVQSYSMGDYSMEGFEMPYNEFVPVVEVIKSMGIQITNQIDDIKTANKRYQDIFENAVEGIFQIDTDGSFIDINPAFARIFGYSSQKELLDEKVSRRFFRLNTNFSCIKEVLDSKTTINMEEFEGLKKDGEKVWLSASARAVRDSKNIVLYYEGSLKDISGVKEKEEALRKQKEADAANRAKTLFIANISHEIRTPLNSVLGMAELLKNTKCSDSQIEYIDILKSSGEFLRIIIDDILDFSKIEAGQLILEEIPFDLNDLIEDALNIVKTKDRVSLEKYIDREITYALLGDPLRLKQILINLIGNAIKFTKEGKVSVEIYPDDPFDDHVSVTFRVADTGIGIEKSKLEVIFQSFSQAEAFTNRQYGGTGLGLAISKRLVGLMGGDLEVESEVNKGSVFYFTINFKVSEESIKNLVMEEMEADLLPHTRILLADDIEPNRTVIRKYLEPYPVEIVETENGLDAYNAFIKEKFDIVLMDVEMPVMNGYEATRLIREWEDENSKGRTPLIIISAHAFGEQKKECFESGCDKLIVKPVKRRDLIQNIYESVKDKMPVIQPEEKASLDEEEEKQKMGDPVYVDSFFTDLMPEFFSYIDETLEVMKKALDENNYKDLERMGHGLKGSSRNYEIPVLGEIFFEIEKLSIEKNGEMIASKLEEVRNYMKTLTVEFIDKD